jgi:electron transfer flavoprotein alpha subunit
MTAAGILVVAETDAGEASAVSFELLGLARTLAPALGGSVTAVVLGDGVGGAADSLAAGGADRVIKLESAALSPYQAEAWLPDLTALAAELAPAAIILAHTTQGADLAPRLGFRLEAGIATGCIAARATDGDLKLTRPCYGGNAHEVLSFRAPPAVFTVKPKCFEATAAQQGQVVERTSVLDPASLRTQVRETRRDDGDGNRLESAEVVVAGGGGMAGAEAFDRARELAELWGGAVGASRLACDLGWCPPGYQIGLSGRTVAPELYLAVGISGAGQHMAGCANAKTIVAINTDADAPIFKYARFGLVADCHELLPALIAAIKARG